MKRSKPEIVTFKADATLLEAMAGIPNRSEFIRAAILGALDNVCPLCNGTGALTPDQRRHWDEFTVDHAVQECDECHVTHLVCAKDRSAKAQQ